MCTVMDAGDDDVDDDDFLTGWSEDRRMMTACSEVTHTHTHAVV